MEPQRRMARSPRTWCAALLCCLSGPLAAQQLYWYDGATRRPLWAEPGVVADFSGDAREKSQVIRSSALSKTDLARQSPVFRDQAQGGGTRALPGGVLVRFNADSTDAQHAALVARPARHRWRWPTGCSRAAISKPRRPTGGSRAGSSSAGAAVPDSPAGR